MTLILKEPKETETSRRPAVYVSLPPAPTFLGMPYPQIAVLAIVGIAWLAVLLALYAPIYADSAARTTQILALAVIVGIWIWFTVLVRYPKRLLICRVRKVDDDSREIDLSPEVEHPLQGTVVPPPERGDSVGTIHR